MIVNLYGYQWDREAPGKYRSIDGKWSIRRWGRGEWYAWHGSGDDDVELWGYWYLGRLGRDDGYVPFQTLWEAMACIDEVGVRQDVEGEKAEAEEAASP